MHTEQWHTGGNGLIVYDQNGWPVANAVTYHTKRRDDRQTARLLAAAPELLSALQWAIDQIEDSLDPDHQAALAAAQAAIAKATVDYDE